MTISDPDTKTEIEEWAKKVNEYDHEHLGDTNVLLQSRGPTGLHDNSVCRYGECSMGNMLTDAFVHQHITVPTEDRWTDVAVAIMNAGGMRQTIEIGKLILSRKPVLKGFFPQKCPELYKLD